MNINRVGLHLHFTISPHFFSTDVHLSDPDNNRVVVSFTIQFIHNYPSQTISNGISETLWALFCTKRLQGDQLFAKWFILTQQWYYYNWMDQYTLLIHHNYGYGVNGCCLPRHHCKQEESLNSQHVIEVKSTI